YYGAGALVNDLEELGHLCIKNATADTERQQEAEVQPQFRISQILSNTNLGLVKEIRYKPEVPYDEFYRDLPTSKSEVKVQKGHSEN
ncbi:hypothetical protein L9F63_010582, partial [Diploptera punctata]